MSGEACAAAGRAERGTVLVLFVLLSFGLFALAAMLIDVAMARVVRAGMLASVDAGAHEGLRLRDVPFEATSPERDLLRRDAARSIMLAGFSEIGVGSDGLVDGSQPNTGYAFGLGPDLALDGEGAASGLIVVGASGRPVLLPDVQLNLPNESHGDLVAGSYQGSPGPAECALFLGLPPGFDETSSYARCDFEVPLLPDDSPQQPSFLARLRRTDDASGLDAVAGVSSGAPRLPLLFGQAALLARDGLPAAGIALRAVAIADARPATVASLATPAGPGLVEGTVDLDGDLVGDVAASVSLQLAAWTSCLDDSSATSFAVTSEGLLTSPGCVAGASVGMWTATGATWDGCLALGEPVAPLGAPLGPPLVGPAWIALHEVFGSEARIVGFGAVQVSVGPSGDLLLLRLSGADGNGFVAPSHASARPRPEWFASLDTSVVSQLLTLNASIPAPLRAAVRAR